jgi:TonB family protein
MLKLLVCVLVLLTLGQSPLAPKREDCAPAHPARVWSPIVPASATTRVEPTWPNVDAQGIAVLDVWIDERGDVACVKAVRAMPVLDRAAIEAVRQWKFTPASLRGRPIAVVQTVTVLKPPLGSVPGHPLRVLSLLRTPD